MENDRTLAVASKIARLRKTTPRGGGGWFDPAPESVSAKSGIRRALNCEYLPIALDGGGMAAASGGEVAPGHQIWFCRQDLSYVAPISEEQFYKNRYLRGLGWPFVEPLWRLRSPRRPPSGVNIFPSFAAGQPYRQDFVPEGSPSALDGRVAGWMIPHVVGEAHLIDWTFGASSAWRKYLDTKNEPRLSSPPSEFGIGHIQGFANAITPDSGYQFDEATYDLVERSLREIDPWCAGDPARKFAAAEYLVDWLLWSMGCPGVPDPPTGYSHKVPSRLYQLFVGDPLTEEFASPTGLTSGGKLLRFLAANPYPYFSLLYDSIAGVQLPKQRKSYEPPEDVRCPALAVASTFDGNSYCEKWEVFVERAEVSLYPAFVSDGETDLKLNWLQAAFYVPRAVYPFASDTATGADFVPELRKAIPRWGMDEIDFVDSQPFAPFLLYRRRLSSYVAAEAPQEPAEIPEFVPAAPAPPKIIQIPEFVGASEVPKFVVAPPGLDEVPEMPGFVAEPETPELTPPEFGERREPRRVLPESHAMRPAAPGAVGALPPARSPEMPSRFVEIDVEAVEIDADGGEANRD